MEDIVRQICLVYFQNMPASVNRCSEGIGNYVYAVECSASRYIVRLSLEKDAYKETIHWLGQLSQIQIPVPQVIGAGNLQQYEYLLLTYLEGKDIGLIYPQLTTDEKRTIAKEVVQIQNRVAEITPAYISTDWSWHGFIEEMLDRAEERIGKNGYFDREKVRELRKQKVKLENYFSQMKPIPYLDDISSKNLLIHHGKISGIIDVDWIGLGDQLTYVALTHVALLNLEYGTDYVSYLLEEMQITDIQKKAFVFYSLMYCVDFMGERGMSFTGKKVEVNPQIIDRLNHMYDLLWSQWCEM